MKYRADHQIIQSNNLNKRFTKVTQAQSIRNVNNIDMNKRKYLQFFRAILEEYILNTEINLGRNKTVDRVVDKLRNIVVFRAEEAKNARHERDSQPLRTKRMLCM